MSTMPSTKSDSGCAPADAVNGPSERRGRRWLSYANVTSTIALVIAIGGGSAFAATRLITGNQIAPGTITAKNIKRHSLLRVDFKAGQLPAVAFGQVSVNGANVPAFVANSGFPGRVSSPVPGTFCVVPPRGYAGVPVVVTTFGAANTQFQQVLAQKCPGHYQIQAAGNVIGPGQGFTIVVPLWRPGLKSGSATRVQTAASAGG